MKKYVDDIFFVWYKLLTYFNSVHHWIEFTLEMGKLTTAFTKSALYDEAIGQTEIL